MLQTNWRGMQPLVDLFGKRNDGGAFTFAHPMHGYAVIVELWEYSMRGYVMQVTFNRPRATMCGDFRPEYV